MNLFAIFPIFVLIIFIAALLIGIKFNIAGFSFLCIGILFAAIAIYFMSASSWGDFSAAFAIISIVCFYLFYRARKKK